MIGKTVKVKDPWLLTFFYPTFKVKDELSFSDRDCDIIYNGPMRRGLKEYLQSNTKRFISVTGVPDLDFNNKDAVIEYVYNRMGKEAPTDVIESAKNYDDDYFLYCIKVLWVTGRWVGSKASSDVSIFSLFASTTESVRKSIEVYFKLAEDMPGPVIDSSFITFLSRVKNLSDQSVSNGYMKLLKQCEAKFGSKIKPAVYKYSMRDNIRDDLLFIDLVTDLK